MPDVGQFGIANVRIVRQGAVRPGCILVRDGLLAAVHADPCEMPHELPMVDGGGRILAPGFIDIHVHGGGGYDLMSDDPEQARAYAHWVTQHGVTGFLVSTSGRDHAEILRKLRALAPIVGARIDGAARVLGFHLEGPYINPARKGAFPPSWLRPPSADEYRELFEASGSAVRQVTLAPELPGADGLIDAVVASGATAAIGHTDATYEQALAALERGCTHVTHTFNAMRPFGHRDPGVLGAAMAADGVTCELIADGAHVDFAAARVLLRARGASNVALITDGMPLAGTADGDGTWEGQPIRVEGGKAVRSSDGTIIGGVITMDVALRNAVRHMELSLPEASASSSAVPARAIGLGGDYGAIEPGFAADFVLVDDDLTVNETWVAGQKVWPGG